MAQKECAIYIDEDGSVIRYFYLHGIEINDVIKEWAKSVGIGDIMNPSGEELTMFKLTWNEYIH